MSNQKKSKYKGGKSIKQVDEREGYGFDDSDVCRMGRPRWRSQNRSPQTRTRDLFSLRRLCIPLSALSFSSCYPVCVSRCGRAVFSPRLFLLKRNDTHGTKPHSSTNLVALLRQLPLVVYGRRTLYMERVPENTSWPCGCSGRRRSACHA